MKHRPSYSVATTVVVLTILLAFVAAAVKPLISNPPTNAIATHPGDFLKQAATERIEWRAVEPSAFADARRLDRPILLIIGVAWSRNGREFDQEVFTPSDVQNYINRNFVAIRVDAQEMPAWLSAYLPLTRASLGLRPRLQIWILEPDGRIVSNISRRKPETHIDSRRFLEELVRMRKAYTQMRVEGIASTLGAQHQDDIAKIEAPGTRSLPDFAAVSTAIQSTANREFGGFPVNGYQDLRPYAWSYLGQTGQTAVLRDSLMPFLRSPGVDVLDGGFFAAGRQLNWNEIEFDKMAVQTAEMASMLTAAQTLMPRQDQGICDYVTRKAVASLANEFLDENGFIRPARIGDERPNGRSQRSSVSPRRLREVLDPEDRQWARDNLGLRVETNPLMVPCLTGQAPSTQEEAIIQTLRAAATPSTFANGTYMDVTGTVAARIMEIGRWRGDASLISFGSDLFNRIDATRVSNQVPHDLIVSVRSPATLIDYLAYSDAALQDYLSSGRVVSLQNGLAVLQRALSTFAGPNPGEYRIGLPPGSDLLPDTTIAPQLVDDVGESASAKIVRLCTSYGWLLLGTPSETNPGVLLLRSAFATESLMAEPASGLGIFTAAFSCSSALLADNTYGITVGQDAQALADGLASARPYRFIAPAFGPVRPDLRDKPAGIYVVRDGVPSGPLSIEQALNALPRKLNVGN